MSDENPSVSKGEGDPAPASNPESRARETISDLLHGKVRPQTVADLDTAVTRAKRDGAVGRISGR